MELTRPCATNPPRDSMRLEQRGGGVRADGQDDRPKDHEEQRARGGRAGEGGYEHTKIEDMKVDLRYTGNEDGQIGRAAGRQVDTFSVGR